MNALIEILASRDPASRRTIDRDLLSQIMRPRIVKLALNKYMELLGSIIRNPKAFGTGGLAARPRII